MSSREATSVLFRSTCSSAIGFGHLRRCLTLAAEIAAGGKRPTFALTGDARGLKMVEKAGFTVQSLTGAPADPAPLLAGTPDVVVVDDYAADAAMFRALQGRIPVVVVIDDLADRDLAVDVVQNGSMHAPTLPYRVPADCARLLGPPFAMLRSGFSGLPARSTSPVVRRVLITMGGADPKALTLPAARAVLASLPEATVDVVIGPLFQPPPELERDVARGQVRLHRSPPDLVALMLAADLAVSAGGQTTFELAAAGLPSVAISMAENQEGILASHAAAPTLLVAEGTQEAIAAGLTRLAGDEPLRRRMAEVGQRTYDGKGTSRVAAAILDRLSGRKSS